MLGNVWEWCQDGYGRYDAEFRERSGAQRVFRGGSWYRCPLFDDYRSAKREWTDNRTWASYIGFRVAGVQ